MYFDVKFDNEWLYKIVEDSDVLKRIMSDIQSEMPSFVKEVGIKDIRHSTINFIINPKPFTTYSSTTAKYIRILRRNLSETKEFAHFDRVATRLRGNVNKAVRTLNITSNFEELLGCNADELIQHIEKQFQEGMTWENYGKKGWHIDHIKPLCSFVLTEPDQVRKATHYTNLRPLWAKDNIKKGATTDKKLSVRKKKK